MLVSLTFLSNAQINNKLFYGYITVYGTVYADQFNGDGSSITNIQASYVEGILTPLQLPSTIIYQFETNVVLGGVVLTSSNVIGNIVGNLLGNVTGNVTGNVDGALTGTVTDTNSSTFNNVSVNNLTVVDSITLPSGGGGLSTPVKGVQFQNMSLINVRTMFANVSSNGYIVANVDGVLGIVTTNVLGVLVTPFATNNTVINP